MDRYKKDTQRNPWESYEAHKQEMLKLQKKVPIERDSKSYNKHIACIVDKLKI